MDARHGKMRMNVEGDRLSALPDELIHKILYSFDIKEVIEISGLSSRWRFIWTSMPYLNFISEEFSTLRKFGRFITHFLPRRDNQAEVHSLNLGFRGKVTQAFVKRILNYVFSHNIQDLYLQCLPYSRIEFPLPLLNSRSLKELTLVLEMDQYLYGNYLTSTWELPALTTLELRGVTLRDDSADKCVSVFSKCANLKKLTLEYFAIKGSTCFSIVHPRLSNLTLDHAYCDGKVVNVAAPQLKNLTIRDCNAKLVISAPNLASLLYEGYVQFNLSSDGFRSLEMADICVTDPKDANAHQIVSSLQELHNVNFLTLNVGLVEFLSSSVGPLLHQLSSFVKLKSFKIYPDESYWSWGTKLKKEHMSTKLKSYLLDISLGCTFTIILPEEIKAESLMVKLRWLLVKEKDRTKREQASVETYKSKTEMMAQFGSCWENLVVHIEQNKENVRRIISILQHIEELLVKLPASRRAKIQPCFSSLCVEAGNTLSKITDYTMICCEESQSRSNVLLQELATELVEPSS